MQILKHLTDIFNLSFTTGIFPNSLKSAEISKFIKKTSKLVVSNSLSDLDKIIEKWMYNRIIKFLEEKKIYYKQFGFCKNFSTAHAIITLMENIQKAFDNDKFPYMYIYTHTYIYMCVNVHVHVCRYMCVYTCMCVHICVYCILYIFYLFIYFWFFFIFILTYYPMYIFYFQQFASLFSQDKFNVSFFIHKYSLI